MIKQREKLKNAKLESLEEQVQMTANILFCEQPIIPMSKRRLDKVDIFKIPYIPAYSSYFLSF
jgi:hypothetical protein